VVQNRSTEMRAVVVTEQQQRHGAPTSRRRRWWWWWRRVMRRAEKLFVLPVMVRRFLLPENRCRRRIYKD
jgi:hypothetical protein